MISIHVHINIPDNAPAVEIKKVQDMVASIEARVRTKKEEVHVSDVSSAKDEDCKQAPDNDDSIHSLLTKKNMRELVISTLQFMSVMVPLLKMNK